MNILFNIGHPAQVHLFKNLIWELERKGHKCKITTIDKDVTLQLLDAYGFEYAVVGNERSTLPTKAIELIRIESKIYRIAHSFKPDLLIGGVGNVYIAHVGRLLRKPSIVFDDTEHAKIDHFLMDPFVNVIYTPSCYRANLGQKQVRYNGFHELAYLHPRYYTPNPTVLDELELNEDDPFIIVRFVSWRASHDVGQHGIQNKVKLVTILEKYGQVLITSENGLPEELQSYHIQISPEKMHDLIYYATLYIGEGGTMAAEAAILGTPAIYVSSLSGKIGNFIELEETYDLLFSFSNENRALNKSIEIVQNLNVKDVWRLKRERLLHDKIDVTAFMTSIVESCPKFLEMIQSI